MIKRYYKFKVLAGSWHGSADGSYPCASNETRPFTLRPLVDPAASTPAVLTKGEGTVFLQWSADPQVKTASQARGVRQTELRAANFLQLEADATYVYA